MNPAETITTHLRDLKERFRVRRIGVFGSFASGSERDESDVEVQDEKDDLDGPDGRWKPEPHSSEGDGVLCLAPFTVQGSKFLVEKSGTTSDIRPPTGFKGRGTWNVELGILSAMPDILFTTRNS